MVHVQFQVCVSCVVECLAEAGETVAEDLSVYSYFIWIFGYSVSDLSTASETLMLTSHWPTTLGDEEVALAGNSNNRSH